MAEKNIKLKDALQAHPEFLNEQHEDHDKAVYAQGWNACIKMYVDGLKELGDKEIDIRSADNLARWHDFLAGSGEDTESSVEEPEDSRVIVEKTDKFHIYKLDDSQWREGISSDALRDDSNDPADIPEKVSDKRVMSGSFELYFGEGVSASDLYEILKKHLDDEGVVCGQIKVDFYRRDI